MSFAPEHTVAWTEIPVRDLDAGVAFYAEVMNYTLTIDETGPNPVAFLPTENFETGVSGHLYPGKPAAPGTGCTIHLNVPDTLEETAARFSRAGGTMMDPIIEIPPGRFQYGTDPDGNSIGLFEAKKAA